MPRREIFINNSQKFIRVGGDLVKKLVRKTLKGRTGSNSLKVSIVITDDKNIRKINKEFLGHDYATDVISFSLKNKFPKSIDCEVVVSAQTAAREAKDRGLDPCEELHRYIVHGVLHYLGYQDKDPASKKKMFTAQEKILDL